MNILAQNSHKKPLFFTILRKIKYLASRASHVRKAESHVTRRKHVVWSIWCIGHSLLSLYYLLLPPTNVVLQSHDIVCVHYDLEQFVHVTQCVFSKLLQDGDGNTPLIMACQGGHVETARVLLKHGANVDQQNNVSSIIMEYVTYSMRARDLHCHNFG